MLIQLAMLTTGCGVKMNLISGTRSYMDAKTHPYCYELGMFLVDGAATYVVLASTVYAAPAYTAMWLAGSAAAGRIASSILTAQLERHDSDDLPMETHGAVADRPLASQGLSFLAGTILVNRIRLCFLASLQIEIPSFFTTTGLFIRGSREVLLCLVSPSDSILHEVMAYVRMAKELYKYYLNGEMRELPEFEIAHNQ